MDDEISKRSYDDCHNSRSPNRAMTASPSETGEGKEHIMSWPSFSRARARLQGP